MASIEISNGEIVHGAGREQMRHPAHVRCGECPQATVKRYHVRFDAGDEVQEASGSAETVAAFLRALAEQLAPTRPVTRGRGMVPEPDPVQVHTGGFNVLPRPTP